MSSFCKLNTDCYSCIDSNDGNDDTSSSNYFCQWSVTEQRCVYSKKLQYNYSACNASQPTQSSSQHTPSSFPQIDAIIWGSIIGVTCVIAIVALIIYWQCNRFISTVFKESNLFPQSKQPQFKMNKVYQEYNKAMAIAMDIAETELREIISNDWESSLLPTDVRSWDVDQVGIWIKSLGLKKSIKSIETFKKANIDGFALLRATSDTQILRVTNELHDFMLLESNVLKLYDKWQYRYVTLPKLELKPVSVNNTAAKWKGTTGDVFEYSDIQNSDNSEVSMSIDPNKNGVQIEGKHNANIEPMDTLKNMGFMDEEQNMEVLEQGDGDLNVAIQCVLNIEEKYDNEKTSLPQPMKKLCVDNKEYFVGQKLLITPFFHKLLKISATVIEIEDNNWILIKYDDFRYDRDQNVEKLHVINDKDRIEFNNVRNDSIMEESENKIEPVRGVKKRKSIIIPSVPNLLHTDSCKECIVCMDDNRSYACVPCGHLCLCQECKDLIDATCPICQMKYDSFIKIYS